MRAESSCFVFGTAFAADSLRRAAPVRRQKGLEDIQPAAQLNEQYTAYTRRHEEQERGVVPPSTESTNIRSSQLLRALQDVRMSVYYLKEIVYSTASKGSLG